MGEFLVGRTFELVYGVCKVIEVKNGVVFLQNVDKKSDTRQTPLPMFEMSLQNGIIKEV